MPRGIHSCRFVVTTENYSVGPSAREATPPAQLIFVEGDIMPSATIAATAYTEQPAPLPKSASENVPVPQALWIILILSFILWVLLAWKALDEWVDSDRDDDSINWFPPY